MKLRAVESVEACQELLSAERSASECYGRFHRMCEDEVRRAELGRMREHHDRWVTFFERLILSMGEMPGVRSGLWGARVERAANGERVWRRAPGMEALVVGETSSIHLLERHLEAGVLPKEAEKRVRGEILPTLRRHVQRVNRMMKKG